MPRGGLYVGLLTSFLLVAVPLGLAREQLLEGATRHKTPQVKVQKESKRRLLLELDDKPYLVEDRHQNAIKHRAREEGHNDFPPTGSETHNNIISSRNNNNNNNRNNNNNNRHNRRNTPPTASPRPDPANKKEVQWHEDTHYYALKASIDERFRIRHAPIPEPGSPWPMPQVFQPSYTVFPLDLDGFQIHPIGEHCDILEQAFKRLLRNIFLDDTEGVGSRHSSFFSGSFFGSDSEENPGSVRPINSLNVTVLKECEDIYPSIEMDESYDLEVKKSGASLIAREVWGALRGLETFGQLVYQNDNNQYVINKTYVHDYPRFAHRGILLDTARHYLNKDTIITNLEIMAQNKMNVFHWHIVDDQSFPFESKTFPDLSKKGAYDPETHVYTIEDIAEIVEEARLRGIRVVPEFDTPGHTYSWGYGQDFLLTPCYDYRKQPNGFYGPINPILKATYRFLQGLFQEVLKVYPDKYVHLGGDEVPFDCWYSNPFISSFIRRNNLTDVRDLLNLYERKLLDIITHLGRQREQGAGYIVWQEVFDNGVKLKPDTIVQVWSGDAFDVGRVTGAGHRALFSTCWYLDYTNYGQDWDKYYKCEQIGQMLDDYRVPNQTLLLGGEACLWTEFADDESILPRLWPRASAAAERLWSNRYLMDVDAAAPRIEAQRCRMIRRGLPVGVLGGPGHCKVHKKGGVRPGKDWRMSKVANEDVIPKENPRQMGKVYVVDINAVYVVPLLVLICLCCLVIFSTFFQSESKSRLVGIFNIAPTHWRFKARSLIVVFMVFVFAWCLWTSPVWMHLWETSNAHTSRATGT